jgi:hypothetical protein
MTPISTEWGDDRPSRTVVRVRCPGNGCGWGGYATLDVSFGARTLVPEDCPLCGSIVEIE